jgi:hypothetical protein
MIAHRRLLPTMEYQSGSWIVLPSLPFDYLFQAIARHYGVCLNIGKFAIKPWFAAEED